MIETLPDLPEGVFGFRAVGAVEADDYATVLDPVIDGAVADGRRLNLVFELGPEFERYTLGAMWQDALLEGKPGHVWGRLALVTDHELIAEIVHGLSFLVPGQVKIFSVDALADAIAWAAEGPGEDGAGTDDEESEPDDGPEHTEDTERHEGHEPHL